MAVTDLLTIAEMVVTNLNFQRSLPWSNVYNSEVKINFNRTPEELKTVVNILNDAIGFNKPYKFFYDDGKIKYEGDILNQADLLKTLKSFSYLRDTYKLNDYSSTTLKSTSPIQEDINSIIANINNANLKQYSNTESPQQISQ